MEREPRRLTRRNVLFWLTVGVIWVAALVVALAAAGVRP